MLWPTQQRMVFVVCVALALGAYRTTLLASADTVTRYNNADGLTLEGVVIDPPDLRDDRLQFRLRAEWLYAGYEKRKVSGLVLVSAPRSSKISYAQRVQVTGRLRTPPRFDTFSYADYLARQGVFSLMPDAVVVPLTDGATNSNPLRAALIKLRSQAQQHIQNALPDPQAALLTGILLGNERGIAPQIADDFALVGAAHIVAISGFNMVIIGGTVMGLTRAFLPRGRAAVVGLLVIALYTAFVGGNAAVVRAAIMSSLLIIAEALRRKVYLPASLAFAVLLMSLENPLVLWDVSFQLSFGAVLGIALFAGPLQHLIQRGANAIWLTGAAASAFRVLRDTLAVTLAVLVFTLPLTVLYFERFSPYILLVNLLIVPVQAALLILGALATMLAFLWPDAAQMLYWMDILLLSWSIGTVRGIADWPLAGLNLGADPRLVSSLFVIAILGAVVHAARPAWAENVTRWLRQSGAWLWLMLAGCGISLLMLAAFLSRPDGRLHLWLLDVGHSNAVLMQTPGGAHVLVDGGRYPSRLLTAIGERLPFRDRTLEALFITQADPFDTEALPALLARYDAALIIDNGQLNLSPEQDALNDAIADHTRVTVTAGYTLQFSDGTLIEVLHPSQPPSFGTPAGDAALVLRVSYGDVSFLLTGDLTQDAQTGLLASGQWPVASVMQVPQHGTARSLDAAFLQAVQPQVAILHADPANLRNDPHIDTLDMLDAAQTPLLRTDAAGQAGSLHLWTDGVSLWALNE